MPKSYSKNEQEQIIKKLKMETKILLSKYGVRKTSVDELVKSVNIPKGTFYLFYASKEHLLFEVIAEEQEVIQNSLLDLVAKCGDSITSKQFSEIILSVYKSTTNSFLYTLNTSGEMEILMRKLPSELVLQHIEQDDAYLDKLFTLLPKGAKGKISIFSGALRGIFLMAIHKREIGETVFDDTIKLLIDGITQQIFAEKV